MKLKFFLLTAIVTCSIAASVIFSREIYSFSLWAYYNGIKKQSYEQMYEKAANLFEKKDYTRLESYLDDMLILYPDDSRFIRMKGQNYIKLGYRKRGVDLIILSMNAKHHHDVLSNKTVDVLFQDKYYGDIAALFELVEPQSAYQFYVYGVSLFKTKKYSQSVKKLKKSISHGKTGHMVYYYLGMAYGRTGDNVSSLKYLKKSIGINPYSREVRQALAALYRKTGKFELAEKIIRDM